MNDQKQDEKQSVIFQKLDELKELNATFENVNGKLNERAEWILSKEITQSNVKNDEQEIGDCKLSTDLIEICNNYVKNIKTLQSLIGQIRL